MWCICEEVFLVWIGTSLTGRSQQSSWMAFCPQARLTGEAAE